MSEEKSHVLNWHNGKEQVSIVPYVSDGYQQECNFCWCEYAFVSISKMLSSEIWPPPKPDRPMFIGPMCISSYVSINIKYIAFRVLVEVVGVNRDVSDVIIGYL